MTHLYKIRTKKKELILFQPNKIQQHIIKRLPTTRPLREWDLKYRQGGVSTFWLIYWLDDTIFTENAVTAILADCWANLGKLWKIIRIAYENMPPEIKPILKTESAKSLSFAYTNSEIGISLSVRSSAVHNLHISEVCYIDEEEITATMGAISRQTTNITCESTGNGIANYGYTMYQEAKTGENGFNANFFPWFLQDEYAIPLNGMRPLIYSEKEKDLIKFARKEWDIDISQEQILWRRETQHVFKGRFPEAYPENEDEAFLMSGDRFFNPRKAMVLLQEAQRYNRLNPPIEKTQDYDMWEEYDPQCIYAAGADVAEGVGGDFSALKIFNVTKKREAFRFRARVAIDTFYRVCDKWGRYYGKCLLAIERNNHGHAVLLGLDETTQYPNLYYEERSKRLGSGGSKRLGWPTTEATRTPMLDALKEAIEEEGESDEEHFEPEFEVKDETFIKEVLTFINSHGKLEAESGAFDDCLIATAIAYQMYLKERPLTHRTSNFGIYIGEERTYTVS